MDWEIRKSLGMNDPVIPRQVRQFLASSAALAYGRVDHRDAGAVGQRVDEGRAPGDADVEYIDILAQTPGLVRWPDRCRADIAPWVLPAPGQPVLQSPPGMDIVAVGHIRSSRRASSGGS